MKKMKKRPSGHNSLYPEKRKKKRLHVQLISFERVTERWQITPFMFYMFFIDNSWWACEPEGNFYGNVCIDGDYYKQVYPVDFYDGQNGDVVMGYVGVINSGNMSIHKGRLVFVKNALSAGVELSRSLTYKSEVRMDYYKRFEIWKT